MNPRVFLIAALILIPATAQARHHHRATNRHQPVYSASVAYSTDKTDPRYGSPVLPMGNGHLKQERPLATRGLDFASAGSRPSGCPHAWCGCGTSLKVFGKIIPELNLAANWRRFPPTVASAGMVAWRWGHVFYIESVNSDGTVVAYDPNSGGHVAHVHTISLRGFHVVNPHGSRYSSL